MTIVRNEANPDDSMAMMPKLEKQYLCLMSDSHRQDSFGIH